MKTKKLYEIDSHLWQFESCVSECLPCKNGFKIALDETAFFPEGGGQASDNGFLGDVEVFDVQIENNIIYHFTKVALPVGEKVKATVNYSRRFAFMQNHTGEHIVSAVAHKLYGANNVGFHLGEDFVTVDFDKQLSREQLDVIEFEANRKVWENLDVRVYYPTKTQLSEMDYRSKKEIEGEIRIVEIANTDICACCAPHVNNTGEIGIIKLLDFERMRGGIRVYLKCGKFALADYRLKYENIRNISALLSAKQEEAASAVVALEQKYDDEKLLNTKLKQNLANIVVSCTPPELNCVFLEDCDIKQLQIIADRLHKTHGGIRAVFSGDEMNYSFAICANAELLDRFFEKFKANLNVRGGGRNGMVQGTVLESKERIKMFF